MKIFALSGLCTDQNKRPICTKGAGKDTFAEFCTDILGERNVTSIAFADPLKEAALALLQADYQTCYGSDFHKNQWVCQWGIVGPKICEKYNKREQDPMSMRDFMAVFGSDILRHHNSNIWIDLLKIRLDHASTKLVIITDIRFKNELEFAKSINAIPIRIRRQHGKNASIHISEQEMLSVSDEKFKYIIKEKSNKTLKTLRNAVLNILRQEQLVNLEDNYELL